MAALVLLGYTCYVVWTRDTTAPVITDSVGELHLENTQDSHALLQGLSATDDRDGDLTDQILVERLSRFIEPGVCNVSYVVFDSNNNICQYERRVVFDNYTPPVITLSKPLLYYQGSEITFMDRFQLIHALEGDISHKLKLEASNVDPDEVGIYEVQLSAVTAYGEKVYARFPLNVVSYSAQAPMIELTQNLVYVKQGEPFDPKVYVSSITDSNKNDIDISVVHVFSQVDTSKPGYGQVRMEVNDEFGNKGVTFLTVIVEE